MSKPKGKTFLQRLKEPPPPTKKERIAQQQKLLQMQQAQLYAKQEETEALKRELKKMNDALIDQHAEIRQQKELISRFEENSSNSDGSNEEFFDAKEEAGKGVTFSSVLNTQEKPESYYAALFHDISSEDLDKIRIDGAKMTCATAETIVTNCAVWQQTPLPTRLHISLKRHS